MTPVFYMFADRQKSMTSLKQSRVTVCTTWFRIGGTAHDLPNNWQHLISEGIVGWMPKRLNDTTLQHLKLNLLVVISQCCAIRCC